MNKITRFLMFPQVVGSMYVLFVGAVFVIILQSKQMDRLEARVDTYQKLLAALSDSNGSHRVRYPRYKKCNPNCSKPKPKFKHRGKSPGFIHSRSVR